MFYDKFRFRIPITNPPATLLFVNPVGHSLGATVPSNGGTE